MNVKNKKKQNSRTLKPAVAVIIDGQTEQWYIEQIKVGYRPTLTKSLKITPELPQKKTVKELFSIAKGLIEQEYTKVFLILDLDEILKNPNELKNFKAQYSNYTKPSGKNKWMEKLTVIVNIPCLEYWYYLHFHKTTRFYPDYNSLISDLKKCSLLNDYEKPSIYYNKTPNIYQTLSAHIEFARSNAHKFNFQELGTVGCSEMFLLLDFIDSLDKTKSETT